MAKFETIWKVQIDLDRLDQRGRTEILLPEGAVVVHVATAVMARMIELWARVDPEAPMRTRKFRVAGTGHPLVQQERYIGTVHESRFVWHVFEVETP